MRRWTSDPGERFRSVHVAWLVVAVGYAAVAARFEPLSWPAMLATVPPAVAVYWVSRRRATPTPADTPPEGPDSLAQVPGGVVPARRATWARTLPWLLALAAAAALELLALPRHARDDYPTLSSLITPFAADHAALRTAGYLLWFALGAWLVRRR